MIISSGQCILILRDNYFMEKDSSFFSHNHQQKFKSGYTDIFMSFLLYPKQTWKIHIKVQATYEMIVLRNLRQSVNVNFIAINLNRYFCCFCLGCLNRLQFWYCLRICCFRFDVAYRFLATALIFMTSWSWASQGAISWLCGFSESQVSSIELFTWPNARW